MCRGNLPTIVLKHIAKCALQNPWAPAALFVEPRRVFPELVAAAASFDTDHSHALVTEEGVEHPDGV